jgi:hypothetical protein
MAGAHLALQQHKLMSEVAAQTTYPRAVCLNLKTFEGYLLYHLDVLIR